MEWAVKTAHARLAAHNTLVKQNTEQYQKMALNITKIFQRWPTALNWKLIKDFTEQCVLWSQHLAFECWLAGWSRPWAACAANWWQASAFKQWFSHMRVGLVIISYKFFPAVACFGAAISFLVVFSWCALILKLLIESLRRLDISRVVCGPCMFSKVGSLPSCNFRERLSGQPERGGISLR